MGIAKEVQSMRSRVKVTSWRVRDSLGESQGSLLVANYFCSKIATSQSPWAPAAQKLHVQERGTQPQSLPSAASFPKCLYTLFFIADGITKQIWKHGVYGNLFCYELKISLKVYWLALAG